MFNVTMDYSFGRAMALGKLEENINSIEDDSSYFIPSDVEKSYLDAIVKKEPLEIEFFVKTRKEALESLKTTENNFNCWHIAAAEGSVEALELLTKNKVSGVQGVDFEGANCAFIAAKNNKLDALNYLYQLDKNLFLVETMNDEPLDIWHYCLVCHPHTPFAIESTLKWLADHDDLGANQFIQKLRSGKLPYLFKYIMDDKNLNRLFTERGLLYISTIN